MEIIMIMLHLVRGDVAAIPVSMVAKKFTCEEVLEQVVESKDTSIEYKGDGVWAYYCKKKDV